MKKLFFLFLLLFFISLDASGWKKFKKDNVTLYFSPNIDCRLHFYLIDETLGAVNFVNKLYGINPEWDIKGVFERETDTANGWATSYIKPMFYAYLYLPEEFSELNNFLSYERNLVVHEYTHILQIGLVTGIPWFVNALFGNWVFPSQTVPVWFLEGAAVYSESSIDGTGRLNSILYQQELNSFYEYGNFYPLGSLNGTPDHWMSGGVPYLYGTFFYGYLMEKYGAQKMSDYFLSLSDNVVPYLGSIEAYRVFGSTFLPLYNDFITQGTKPLKTVSSAETFTDFKLASNRSFDNYGINYATAGKESISVYQNGALENVFTPPSVSPFYIDENMLILSLNTVYDNSKAYHDLYVYDLKRGGYSKITKEKSVLDFVKTGENTLFYFSYENAVIKAYEINLKTGEELWKKELSAFDSVYSPYVSSDGKKIVFAGNIRGKDKNLFILYPESGEIEEIEIAGNQYSPMFTDDDTILFSTDFDNKIAPAKIELASLNTLVYQVNEPIAIAPAIKDDKIRYIAFSNDGYFIVEKTLNKNIEALIFAEKKKCNPDFDFGDTEKYKMENAGYFEGLLPSLFMPEFNYEDNFTLKGTFYGKGNTNKRSYELSAEKTFDGTNSFITSLLWYDSEFLNGFGLSAYYAQGETALNNSSRLEYPADYNLFSVSSSLSRTQNFYPLIFSKKISPISFRESFSAGFRRVFKDVEDIYHDPLEMIPDDSPVNYYSLGTSLSILSSGAPSSYLLFSEMNNIHLYIPLSISFNSRHDKTLFFSPSFYYNTLIAGSLKIGFTGRVFAKTSFFDRALFGAGGHDPVVNINFFDLFSTEFTHSVSVRGYNFGDVASNTVLTSNNEIRFHILSIDAGWRTFPLFIKNIQGAVFIDSAAALEDTDRDKIIVSGGTELKLLTQWGYRKNVMLKIGFAQGFTETGFSVFYVAYGNSF